MENTRTLSLRLYSVLEHVGASEKLRELHRDTAIPREIFDTVRESVIFDWPTDKYHCGSSYEGTITPDLVSDRDVIQCQRYPPVVSDVLLSPHGVSFLIVRNSWTYPGHVKLQWMRNGRPWVAGDAVDDYIDWTGRICFKHFQGNKNGPADMYFDENGVHVLDHVGALKCQNIPPYALEWFLRERPYSRPSHEQLLQMSRLGCMFVGAGYEFSGEKEIEWRLSFTLQERQLMSELNPVQHKVYVLLKMIKKNVLGAIFKDETLTSYHCKTCVLFAVQMTPVRAWANENLINCLHQCLRLLITWIEQGNCPNYFIQDLNMFKKNIFIRRRESLLRVLRRIIEMDTIFLTSLDSDHVGDLLINENTSRFHALSAMKRNEYVFKLKMCTARDIRDDYLKIVNGLSKENGGPVSLLCKLGVLQRLETLNGHSAEVTQSLLAYLYPLVHLHIAQGFVSLAYRHPDMAFRQQMMAAVDFHFNEARGYDLVNERLARASVLYKDEQHGECFLLLQHLEKDFANPVNVLCPCTNMFPVTYNDIHDRDDHQRTIIGMEMKDILQSSASCVVFLQSEIEIAPVPLHYEMQRSVGTLPGSRDEMLDVWFDMAVVDPMIYLCLMQYLVTCKLHTEDQKQVTIDKLRAEIDGDNRRVMAGGTSHLFHKETAYNLLGWVYMQEERFAEAFLCFSESWRIRPYHNAVKFHVRDLNAKLINRER